MGIAINSPVVYMLRVTTVLCLRRQPGGMTNMGTVGDAVASALAIIIPAFISIVCAVLACTKILRFPPRERLVFAAVAGLMAVLVVFQLAS